ncbi:MAG: precorrin-8X methylmutase [Nitrospirota bacterium]
MDAILLLGHGSRLAEANKALKDMADMVQSMGDVFLVEIAFLQFGKPDFFEGVYNCISRGAKRVIIHPYFLYKGRHFYEDINNMIVEVSKQYPETEFQLTEPLGIHENIARVILERAGRDGKRIKPLKPNEIEERSFEIISSELEKYPSDFTPYSHLQMPIVKRVIHTTGDLEFAETMRFHPDAVESGMRAIKAGKDILVDVRMVEAGINKRLLEKWGGKVICNIQDSGIRGQESGNETRAELGIEVALQENNNIGIIAIGNAPTALLKVMKILSSPLSLTPCPLSLVIGVPVGFVRAVESKEVLLHMPYPFITCLGRKGGSPVAVAIINALLKMMEEHGR